MLKTEKLLNSYGLTFSEAEALLEVDVLSSLMKAKENDKLALHVSSLDERITQYLQTQDIKDILDANRKEAIGEVLVDDFEQDLSDFDLDFDDLEGASGFDVRVTDIDIDDIDIDIDEIDPPQSDSPIMTPAPKLDMANALIFQNVSASNFFTQLVKMQVPEVDSDGALVFNSGKVLIRGLYESNFSRLGSMALSNADMVVEIVSMDTEAVVEYKDIFADGGMEKVDKDILSFSREEVSKVFNTQQYLKNGIEVNTSFDAIKSILDKQNKNSTIFDKSVLDFSVGKAVHPNMVVRSNFYITPKTLYGLANCDEFFSASVGGYRYITNYCEANDLKQLRIFEIGGSHLNVPFSNTRNETITDSIVQDEFSAFSSKVGGIVQDTYTQNESLYEVGFTQILPKEIKYDKVDTLSESAGYFVFCSPNSARTFYIPAVVYNYFKKFYGIDKVKAGTTTHNGLYTLYFVNDSNVQGFIMIEKENAPSSSPARLLPTNPLEYAQKIVGENALAFTNKVDIEDENSIEFMGEVKPRTVVEETSLNEFFKEQILLFEQALEFMEVGDDDEQITLLKEAIEGAKIMLGDDDEEQAEEGIEESIDMVSAPQDELGQVAVANDQDILPTPSADDPVMEEIIEEEKEDVLDVDLDDIDIDIDDEDFDISDYYEKGGQTDDVGNPTDPLVLERMEVFIANQIPTLDKETYFTHGMQRKEAKRRFYEKYEYGAYNPKFSFDFFAKGGEVSSVVNNLQKGDLLKIKFGSIARRDNEVSLKVRSRNKIRNGRIDKITFENVNQPDGVRFYAYERGNGVFSFAMGDLAISNIEIVSDYAKGGSTYAEEREYYSDKQMKDLLIQRGADKKDYKSIFGRSNYNFEQDWEQVAVEEGFDVDVRNYKWFEKNRNLAKGGEVKFDNDYYGYSARVPYKGEHFLVEMGKNWNAALKEVAVTKNMRLVDEVMAKNVYLKMLKNKPMTPPEYAKGGKTKESVKAEIDEGLKELEEGLEGASKKHKAQSKVVSQIRSGIKESFAKGGKTPLDKEFKFEKNFVIYVPSTSNVGDRISETELNKRVSEVEKLVADEFGGFTKTETDGGYKSQSGEIIEEDIVKVSVFSTDKAWEENEKGLVRAVKGWAKEWGQEAIGFEYEGDLYYIDATGKMAKGGKTYAEGGEIKIKVGDDIRGFGHKYGTRVISVNDDAKTFAIKYSDHWDSSVEDYPFSSIKLHEDFEDYNADDIAEDEEVTWVRMSKGGKTYAEGGKIQDVLNAKYKSELKDFYVNESEKGLVLSHIEIKPDKQGMGTATKVMNDLTKYADNKNLIIGTTPSSDFGSSKTRLTKFYKRFGFVNNKGRNKNFAFKDTMIRNPTSYAEGGEIDTASELAKKMVSSMTDDDVANKVIESIYGSLDSLESDVKEEDALIMAKKDMKSTRRFYEDILKDSILS